MNPWSAPARIRQAHPANQIEDFNRHGGSSFRMATLPLPVQSESLSMPGDDGLGLHDKQCRSPAAPQSCEPYPQESIGATQAQPMATAGALEDQEVMSEGKNLSLQRCSSLKGLASRRKQRENDREHVAEKLQRRLPKFNQFNQNGVFGRDNRSNRLILICDDILMTHSQSSSRHRHPVWYS